MNTKIALALDVPDFQQAEKLLGKVESYLEAVKIGSELFTAVGANILKITTLPIILDLKLHDIPATVAQTIQVIGDLGVNYTTIHFQQRNTLELAAKCAELYRMKLLGVSLLTSIAEEDFDELGYTGYDANYLVAKRSKMMLSCGLSGLVCSPQEIKLLRHDFQQQPFLLVPGIRPSNYKYGSKYDDQSRVGTAKQAIQDGADLIVLGRIIRDAADPIQAIQSILKDIYESSGN